LECGDERCELLNEEGKPFFSRVSVFFWKTETKTLAEVNFDSNGWHGSNVLTNQPAGKWVWQGEGYPKNGS
jgi:hypothetical protein